ncbi:hypothetical protein ACFL6K_02300 [Candidatus Latescibacterota bacterium]
MKRILAAVYILAAVVIFPSASVAGLLATEENILNGRRNFANPQMTSSVDLDSGIGFAVNLLLSGEQDLGQAVKVEILRNALAAFTNISEAKFAFSDISSLKMYEALVMYDLVSRQNLFNEEEKESLKKSINTVLEHYIDSGICEWEDDYWSLGVTPMRIVASSALYALNFQADENSERFLRHARTYLQKNLNISIDSHGAWVADSPGYAGTAIEYIIVTAKLLRNNGFHDHFINPNLKNLFLYEMNLLPPQQSPLVKNKFMIQGAGQTDPGMNYGVKAASAAADIYSYFPNESSNIIWYWNQCGNPTDALGLLFIDAGIPYMMPEGGSGIAGGGIAVLRDNFTRPDESALFAGFGDANGIPDREKHDHSDHGDFSFVWSGIPLIVHDGFNTDGSSESLINRAASRHSIVQYEGAGETPIIPENVSMSESSQDNTIVADMYTDGISQYLSSELVDYVSGEVRLAESDKPISGHLRHFLFIKPDALLIWDQFKSPFPAEWNLWMPIENAQAEGNMLKLFSDNDVELQVLFAGDDAVDYDIEKASPEKKADWPLVMRSEYGSGRVTYVSLDLFGDDFVGVSSVAKSFMENIMFQNGEPVENGIITSNLALKENLALLDLQFDYLIPSELQYLDLSKYSLLVIDSAVSGRDESMLNKNIGRINDYIYEGGNVVWVGGSPSGLRTGGISGPGFIPKIIEFNSGDIDMSGMELSRNNISIKEDPVWLSPNIINQDSLLSWISGNSSESGGASDINNFPENMPSAWSDSWKILASVNISYPVRSYSNDSFGEPSKISVKHPGSEDFFTLLLPRKTGEPYKFNLKDNEKGFVSFSDPVSTWEVKAGDSYWTDANLSVKISSEGGFETLYAFDSTFMTSESDEINADSPMSIYYSSKDDRGTITTSTNNAIRYSRGGMKIHAGEINFYGLKDNLTVERVAYVTTLKVLDAQRETVQWAKVYVNGAFVGSTDSDGTIPIRWNGSQPQVTVNYLDFEASALLVPGGMDIVVGDILE